MARTVGVGIQDFEKIRGEHIFYIDKTDFIRQWWENRDEVTLINRPRRFGKTLTMDMVEKFFSVNYAERSDLFEGLSIWKDEKYRVLQGTYPVIFLSFANIKEKTFSAVKWKMNQIFSDLFSRNGYLKETLKAGDRDFFERVSVNMNETDAAYALHKLSEFMYRYYGKKVLILLDEYDTPMQEAYVNGFWDELSGFIRNLFNATFKGNPYLERAIMTGITRISKESIFSDLNNLKVVTTTSNEYADCFGFTEREVFEALDEYGLSDQKQNVKAWYDGFTFGDQADIYNPWSIINYLDTGKFRKYWANTSSNSLIAKLIREGGGWVKQDFEVLMRGEILRKKIDEEIIYNQLGQNETAIWSLLVASGYLRVVRTEVDEWEGDLYYDLALTNKETRLMFSNMIRDWFAESSGNYNAFIKALLADDLKAMNAYMNRVALATFSYFDTGKNPSGQSEPERFYHGFVLGLLVELGRDYTLTSNRESGFGRYDVMLEPKEPGADAMILEFKVQDTEEEKELTDTVQAALAQIREKNYASALIARGIPKERIRSYGFAFQGKKVLIGRE